MFTRDFMHDTLAWWRCSWSGPRLVAWVWSIRDDHSLNAMMDNETDDCFCVSADLHAETIGLLARWGFFDPTFQCCTHSRCTAINVLQKPSKNCVSKLHTLSLYLGPLLGFTISNIHIVFELFSHNSHSYTCTSRQYNKRKKLFKCPSPGPIQRKKSFSLYSTFS